MADGNEAALELSVETKRLKEQLKRKKAEPWESRDSWARVPPAVQAAILDLDSAEPDIFRQLFTDVDDAAVFLRQLRLGLSCEEEIEAVATLWAHREACADDAWGSHGDWPGRRR